MRIEEPAAPRLAPPDVLRVVTPRVERCRRRGERHLASAWRIAAPALPRSHHRSYRPKGIRLEEGAHRQNVQRKSRRDGRFPADLSEVCG
jgi:hypothetical protein